MTSSDNGDVFPIVVGVSRTGVTPDLSVLDQLYVSNVLGSSYPLSQVASLEFRPSPNFIQHYNKERFSAVKALVKTGYYATEVNREIGKKLETIDLPKGSRLV
ncbi:MAG: efflux RND transporter permease subunit, partial [Bacteroidota bacterium]